MMKSTEDSRLDVFNTDATDAPLKAWRSLLHQRLISVYDDAGNVIETHEHGGHFKEW